MGLGKQKSGKHSKSNMELAIIRLERSLNEQKKQNKKEMKSIKKAIKQNTTINSRLVNLLEMNNQEVATDDSNQGSRLPAVLIDLPSVEVFDKKKKMNIIRKRQYSRDLFVWLLKKYRVETNLPALEESQMESRLCHALEIAKEVVQRCKNKHNLDKTLQWKNVKRYHSEMYRQIEHDAAAYLPLKACTGRWGARLMLSKHWQNVEQGNGQQQ
ncbi:hypothetical protein BDC45DRAFT_512050 [Circinella umbellata]|nr:hypothetical protein BDC45DRAFT_512050 [Circinella umbellata]